MSECHRCGTVIAPTAIQTGVAVLLDGQAYCDPCSDVMFGILSPAKAPKPRPVPAPSIGDTVEAQPIELDDEVSGDDLIEDVSADDIGEPEELEDIDVEDLSIDEPLEDQPDGKDAELEEVDAPLVSADEDIDTGDVELASDLEIESMEPMAEEVTDMDTGTATVEVEAAEPSEFEPLEDVDVSLETPADEVVEEVAVEDTMIEGSMGEDVEELPVEEMSDEEVSEEESTVESLESDSDEAVMEADPAAEDLPDYMEEGVAEEPEAPVLDETEEEKSEGEDRRRKKEEIDALKSRPKAHTKGGKKSRKKDPEISLEEKAANAEQRSQERSKSRDKAAIRKKRNLIIIGVAGLLCLGFGGLFVWKQYFKKKEVQIVKKAIPTYEAEQAKIVELFAKADAAYSELEQMGDSDVEARNTKIREVKALYIDIKQFGTEWYAKVEADNQLTNTFKEEFESYMNRAGERSKHLTTMIKHSVE
ncbi:MAG: hypothetical protein AB7F75_03665 [Planctomycetota bacterium]